MSGTKNSRIWWVPLLLLFSAGISAQPAFTLKLDPGVSLTHKFNERWAANLSLGGLFALDDLNSEDADVDGLERLETRLFVTYKFFNLSSISGGYMFRQYAPDESRGFEHRFTQQYVYIDKWRTYRTGHRVRLEQRIFETGFQNRLRYRFSVEMPLSGQEIDEGEAYIVLSDGLVFSFNRKDQSFENRLEAGMGLQLAKRQKLELRLQHRFSGFTNNQALHIVAKYFYTF